MAACSNHQSLRRVSVDGIKPSGTEWYECKCGQRLLVQIIASFPQDKELAEAERKNVRITRHFTAGDGTEWGSLELAANRNALLTGLAEIEGFLAPRVPELEEGDGYVQQEAGQIEQARARLLKLIAAVYKKEVFADTTLRHLVEDVIGDEALKDDPIYPLYYRVCCMDDQGREWVTPEYAANPEMGRQVQLNAPPVI